MALNYLLDPMFQIENSAGKPATDGWLEVYVHGTRTPYYCASNFDGTLHPFKIKLDSLGSNIVLADDGQAYDVYAYNTFGSLLMSRYNVQPGSGSGGSGGSVGELQHWLGGYGPTYTSFPGDNSGHTLGISSVDIDYVGNFIDRIETCPYPYDTAVDGYIYLKPGLYFVSCIIRYRQDPGALSNTLGEVLVYTGYGNANESLAYQMDSSGPEATGNRHNIRVSFVRRVTENDRNILCFAPATPVDWSEAFIQKLEIVKLDGIAGEPGPQGPAGERGPQGLPGPKGDKGDKGDGAELSAGAAIDISYDTVSVKYGDGLSVNGDNELEVKLGDGLSVDGNGAVALDTEVGDVVETVEKLKRDLDTQITVNFPQPSISAIYDFADPQTWLTPFGNVGNTASMLFQSFTIPINHEIRTVAEDSDNPTLLGIYAKQSFGNRIMLALYEYTFAGEGEQHGSSTYVGDTGPVNVLQGLNEYPLKNRNPSIAELRSDKLYYATLYLPSSALVNGLYLAGCPSYGNASVPSEPRISCNLDNIRWQGVELDMSDPDTTLNLYTTVVVPGNPDYYQYFIGPWSAGYHECWGAPRFYLQVRNGAFHDVIPPLAPFDSLGDDVLPNGTLTQTDIPNFTPSSSNSCYRNVSPRLNVTITAFEWIDGMSTTAGWAQANCVYDSGFANNLSGVSNTVTDLGQVIGGQYPGYAHRITFTTPLALTAGTTYRFLCGCTNGSPYFKVWLDPTDVLHLGNNGWYVDPNSNLLRVDNHAGMWNRLYDDNNNSYVL